MKTISISENLPQKICTQKLQDEIRVISHNAFVQNRLPICWVNPDLSTTTWERMVVVTNIDDDVNDQDIIDIVVSHDCGYIMGVFKDVDDYSLTDNGKSLYRTQRRKLIEYVISDGENMTLDQLKEASEHFSTPPDVRDMFFTLNEQVELGQIFHRRAVKDRRVRHDASLSILMNYLTYAETLQIIDDLTTNGNLSVLYIEFGVEGTTEGDCAALFDYFESKVGTKFENTGFLSKNFTPRGGLTLQQISSMVMSVLRINIDI